MAMVENSDNRSMLLKMQHQFQSPVGSEQSNNGGDHSNNNHNDDNQERSEIRELEEMFSNLNPMAQEFVPPSLSSSKMSLMSENTGKFENNVMWSNGFGSNMGRRENKNGYNKGRKRINGRTSLAQREDVIRRTVYVSEIDSQITEEQLATLFLGCGQVVDCRVCGDPNSVLRFAFVEFTEQEAAFAALKLSGTMLGYYPVKVQPSKTAIAPVNPTLLPQTEDERELCARTVYVTNIDRKVTQGSVKLFFQTVCGEVYRLRLLGDYSHPARIAFVEFAMAESAVAALSCSGVILGSLPIRVSPSKTPVRPRPPRSSSGY